MTAHTPDLAATSGTNTLTGADAAAMRWEALTAAGNVVAQLAAIEVADEAGQVDLARLIRAAPAWRRELAQSGIADLAAIMEPGMATLLAVNARGADPGPAAEALWKEFRAGRSAVLQLLETPA